ncbi:MAG: CPBP family intramembrane metalloprotease [Chloroflexi bacterium]|nr:CPBP family intramembrane metalloprotease [Chloroflexota bacterium]
MLFYAKQRAPIALLSMLALLVVSNLWATLRGIDLSESILFNVQSLIALLAGGLLLASLDGTILMVNWMIGVHPFLRAFDRGFTLLFGRISFMAVISGGLLAALGEETFFRGILQNEIGWIPAALIFALAHVGRGLNLFALWAVIEGLVFGWLYQLTGNLLVPMIVHGLHDAAGMLFARYFYKRPIPPAETLFDWMHMLSGVPARAVAPAMAQIAPADDMETTEIENA